MPTGARSHSADPSAAIGWTSAPPVPLPFEQLLRPDGGGRPVLQAPPGIGLRPAAARRMLARDAVRVLLAGCGTVVPDPWLRPRFAARVERTRGELAPIASRTALVGLVRARGDALPAALVGLSCGAGGVCAPLAGARRSRERFPPGTPGRSRAPAHARPDQAAAARCRPGDGEQAPAPTQGRAAGVGRITRRTTASAGRRALRRPRDTAPASEDDVAHAGRPAREDGHVHSFIVRSSAGNTRWAWLGHDTLRIARRPGSSRRLRPKGRHHHPGARRRAVAPAPARRGLPGKVALGVLRRGRRGGSLAISGLPRRSSRCPASTSTGTATSRSRTPWRAWPGTRTTSPLRSGASSLRSDGRCRRGSTWFATGCRRDQATSIRPCGSGERG